MRKLQLLLMASGLVLVWLFIVAITVSLFDRLGP